MPVLSVTDISKSYGSEPVLENVSFHVEAGEKIGIVGVNGAGKTTLLNILAGELEKDSGSIFMSQDTTLGYLKQKDDFTGRNTVKDEVDNIYRRFERMEDELSELSQRIAAQDGESEALLSRYGELQERFKDEGGYSYKSEKRGILRSMAFTDDYLDKRIDSLSGGERTRLALACLLMEKPDILLLDEPTNHLDIGMLKWLEQFLKAYKGAVLIVSHDRYFLDQMTTKTFEVERRKLKVYNGNYSIYAAMKREQRESDLRAYSKQQDEIKRQEDIIRKFKERGTEHLAKRAKSREKKLEHMEVIDRPEANNDRLVITFHERYKTGNDIFIAEGLEASYGQAATGHQKTVFSDVDFDIKRGERICIVGRNGIGKTTLLKILSGEMEKSGGYLKRGVNLDIGYYDQRQESLDPEKSVMDEIHDSFRLYKNSEIRGFLGRFLFKGESVFATVGDLSGGEKARLALLKLMMSGANVLLLDEPTNHLDIESKEVFEEALLAYPGTIIAVSHDRYFLNKIATKIYELGRGGIVKYEGGYDYYEEKKAEVTSTRGYLKDLREELDDSEGTAPGTGNDGKADDSFDPGSKDEAGGSSRPASGSKEERALKKKEEADARRAKRRKEALEQEIEELEKKISGLEEEMCRPDVATDIGRLGELDKECKEAEVKLERDYEEWGKLIN